MSNQLQPMINMLLIAVIVVCIGMIYLQKHPSPNNVNQPTKKPKHEGFVGTLSDKEKKTAAQALKGRKAALLHKDAQGNIVDEHNEVIFDKDETPEAIKSAFTHLEEQTVDEFFDSAPADQYSAFVAGLYEGVPMSEYYQATQEMNYMTVMVMIKYRALYYFKANNLNYSDTMAALVAHNIMANHFDTLDADKRKSKREWDEIIAEALKDVTAEPNA